MTGRFKYPNVLHPFCNKCGWRKGGVDSWDGRACKCGHSAPAMTLITDEIARGAAPCIATDVHLIDALDGFNAALDAMECG